LQKQYSELFSLAVEDDVSSTRRGASSRGRKPQAKKETNSNSSTTVSNKRSVETSNSKYSSEESSDVSYLGFQIFENNYETLIFRRTVRRPSHRKNHSRRKGGRKLLN
jgi:hypothetical protein